MSNKKVKIGRNILSRRNILFIPIIFLQYQHGSGLQRDVGDEELAFVETQELQGLKDSSQEKYFPQMQSYRSAQQLFYSTIGADSKAFLEYWTAYLSSNELIPQPELLEDVYARHCHNKTTGVKREIELTTSGGIVLTVEQSEILPKQGPERVPSTFFTRYYDFDSNGIVDIVETKTDGGETLFVPHFDATIFYTSRWYPEKFPEIDFISSHDDDYYSSLVQSVRVQSEFQRGIYLIGITTDNHEKQGCEKKYRSMEL